MPMRPMLLSVFVLLLVARTGTAAASEFSSPFLPFGINVGYAWGDATADGQSQDSVLMGVEVSLVKLFDSWPVPWFGAYVDAVFPLDADAASARVSVGPEFGVAILGFDGGYVAEFSDDNGISQGVQGRVLLSGFFEAFNGAVTYGAYLRIGALWDTKDNMRGFNEAGVLLKWPLLLGSN